LRKGNFFNGISVTSNYFSINYEHHLHPQSFYWLKIFSNQRLVKYHSFHLLSIVWKIYLYDNFASAQIINLRVYRVHYN
jgi:hypothetical protein